MPAGVWKLQLRVRGHSRWIENQKTNINVSRSAQLDRTPLRDFGAVGQSDAPECAFVKNGDER